VDRILSRRSSIAEWGAGIAFAVALAIGWAVVGWPGGGPGRDTRLLDDGIVFVSAFIVAAMVHKVIMADYAIKAGPGGIELTRAPLREVKDSTADIKGATDKLVTEVGRTRAELESATTRIKALEDAYLANIKDLDDRLGRLEEASRERD
jgi:septal ring factor EnvC (AmiA/AmiB activator)